MTPRPNAPFGPLSWTVRSSTRLVERLRAEERLPAFAAALPARARVSEPALPLLARGAARGARPRRSSCCCPRTPTPATRPRRPAGSSARSASRSSLRAACARIRARAAAAPRRRAGARARRARARRARLRVGARGRRRAAAGRRRGPRRRVARGDEPGIDALAEALASAGYERVERVEERGQFAVRGGLVDVFPTTGREPLRIELFGDEIEQIRAFSPFTQRALRQVERGDDLSGRRAAARARRDRPRPGRGRRARRAGCSRRSRAAVRPAARLRLAARRGARRLGGGGSGARSTSTARRSSTRCRRASRFSFDAQRPALSARGLSEAENELGGLLRQGLDVVVAFPHRGEALRQQQLLRRVEARPARAGRDAGRARVRRRAGAARLRLARARRRAPARHAGLPQAAAAAPRPRPGRALAELLRPPHGRLRRPRGPRHRPAARLRDEGGRRRHPRLPAARLPRRRPRLRPARADRQGLPLHRRRLARRPRSRSSAARRGTT